jgi:hypothetical protein
MKNDELPPQVYHYSKLRKFLFISAGIVIFLFTFLANFSVGDKIKTAVDRQLRALPACQLQYEDLTVGFFFPRIVFKNPVVPGECFGHPEKSLSLQQLSVRFRGFSFSPLGIKVLFIADVGNSSAYTYAILSPSKQIFRIKDGKFSFFDFAPIHESFAKIGGEFVVNTQVTLEKGKVTDVRLVAQSSNLQILKQNISGLEIPDINIGDFSLKSIYDSQTINIKSLIIGSEKAPLDFNIAGFIQVDPYDFMDSKLDISGTAAFTEQLLNQMALFKLFLATFTATNNRYDIKFRGTLRAPTPATL